MECVSTNEADDVKGHFPIVNMYAVITFKGHYFILEWMNFSSIIGIRCQSVTSKSIVTKSIVSRQQRSEPPSKWLQHKLNGLLRCLQTKHEPVTRMGFTLPANTFTFTLAYQHPYSNQTARVCLFVCLTGHPCGTRLGPGGSD